MAEVPFFRNDLDGSWDSGGLERFSAYMQIYADMTDICRYADLDVSKDKVVFVLLPSEPRSSPIITWRIVLMFP